MKCCSGCTCDGKPTRLLVARHLNGGSFYAFSSEEGLRRFQESRRQPWSAPEDTAFMVQPVIVDEAVPVPDAPPSRVQTVTSRALADRLVDAWARHVQPGVPPGNLNDLVSDVAEALDAARAP